MTSILEYCTKAIIRHLNGDGDLFKQYKDMAMQAHWQEKCIIKVKDVILNQTKQKLCAIGKER